MRRTLTQGAVVQNCYVVKNLDAACERFHARYGIGPFVGGSEFELGQHLYRGRPAPPIAARGVFVQSGALNIELIEVLSDGPNAFRDLYPPGTEGFHHVALFCDDYERERDAWVAAGYPVASEFTVSFGASICYIDASRDFGHMIELYPEHEIIRDMYRQARDAAANWDGTNRMIPWGSV
jgi:hypothetical protein